MILDTLISNGCLCKKTISFFITEIDPEEYLKEKLPEWTIVNLNYPLRTSKNLSEKIKTQTDNSDFVALHKNEFNHTLQVPSNMPAGPEPLVFPESEGPEG